MAEVVPLSNPRAGRAVFQSLGRGGRALDAIASSGVGAESFRRQERSGATLDLCRGESKSNRMLDPCYLIQLSGAPETSASSD